MTNDQQDMCATASMNARALEEMLLTYEHVAGLGAQEAEDVINRCDQIVQCIRECFLKLEPCISESDVRGNIVSGDISVSFGAEDWTPIYSAS